MGIVVSYSQGKDKTKILRQIFSLLESKLHLNHLFLSALWNLGSLVWGQKSPFQILYNVGYCWSLEGWGVTGVGWAHGGWMRVRRVNE